MQSSPILLPLAFSAMFQQSFSSSVAETRFVHQYSCVLFLVVGSLIQPCDESIGSSLQRRLILVEYVGLIRSFQIEGKRVRVLERSPTFSEHCDRFNQRVSLHM